MHAAFFDQLQVGLLHELGGLQPLRLPKPAAEIVDRLAERRILAGVPASRFWPDNPAMANLLIVAATETNTQADFDTYAASLAECLR